MRKFKWVSCIAILFLLAAVAFAQSDNGSITGFAKDPSGANIPKAKVSLRNEATGVRQQEMTNDAGYYVFNSVPAGLYTVSVEAAGFKRFDSVHNKLDPNAILELNAALTVGAATETVEVVASAHVPADRIVGGARSWSRASRSTVWN